MFVQIVDLVGRKKADNAPEDNVDESWTDLIFCALSPLTLTE
jgi:hypothetical protein